MHHVKVRLIPGMKGCFNTQKLISEIHNVNKMKGENYITILIDRENVSEKIPQFMIKILNELGAERNLLDLIERIS